MKTSRFGEIAVDEKLAITFPKGLLGFPSHRRYLLLKSEADSYFLWLQSIDTPELAFAVTDPALFVADYEIPLVAEQIKGLDIVCLSDAQVLVIVNKHGTQLTGNLMGPLVIHAERRRGVQVVLQDKKAQTRVPLVDLGAPPATVMATGPSWGLIR